MKITMFQDIANIIVQQKSDKKMSERLNKILKGGRQYGDHSKVRG